MTVLIRNARVSDAADIVDLTVELGYDVDPSSARSRLSRIIDRSDHILLVAEDSRAVGWMHASLWDLVETNRFAVIAGLVAASNYRRQGIGRALTERAEEWARGEGCSVVRVWSSAGRTAAHRFYERLGCANIKTQYWFAKCLDSAAQGELEKFVPRIEET